MWKIPSAFDHSWTRKFPLILTGVALHEWRYATEFDVQRFERTLWSGKFLILKHEFCWVYTVFEM